MTVSTRNGALETAVIGRRESFFGDDLRCSADELAELIGGSRILFIGGAGSIGFETLRTVLQFEPERVDVVDHNENGLAEVVRSLRSATDLPPLRQLRTLPFDYGGAPFRLWLAANGAEFDYVLNFAALKHVRSEKDAFSVLAMLENNVVHLDRLAQLLAAHEGLRRVFSVSTDKAANPSSMMGATKRLMEHALFLPTQPWSPTTQIASARFANVAFSNGSLLNSWQLRIDARQPLACPRDTRRFFVSLPESGHLCTLAGFLSTDRTITVPALDPSQHLVVLADVAGRFLQFRGFEPHYTDDEAEALERVEELAAQRRWPVLLTALDTAGEKPYEEFVGVDERLGGSRFNALRELAYLPPADPGSFADLVATVSSILGGGDHTVVDADGLKGLIAGVEPAFARTHRASLKSLDERI